MNKIQELQAKRARIWQQAKDFLDEKQKHSDVLSTEDNATYERMEQDVVNLGHEIDRLHKQAEIEAQLKKPTSNPIITNPHQGQTSNYAQDF